LSQPTDSDHPLSIIAGTAASEDKVRLWSLVLWSAGISHEVVRNSTGWIIKVAPADGDNARRELAAFEEENKNWPPPVNHRADKTLAKSEYRPPTVLMMGGLMILYAISGPWHDHSPWFEHGAVLGRRILLHGEWWRVITGLTLHADPVHLLGNLFIGGFLVHFLCRLLGTGFGWLLVLSTGALGNYLNILSHGTGHNSVGFSTAVFGTIGVLAGYQCLLKGGVIKEALMPLAAGVALLAFLGASGEHTDLGAHLFGLLVGTGFGVFLAMVPGIGKLVSCRPFQSALFFLCLVFIILCWNLAWNSSL